MRISSRGFSLKIFSQRPSLRIAASASSAYMSSTSRYHLQKGTQLVIQKGDITKWDGDAVVNAANPRMLGGGGVDGAIHTAAGPGLLQACKRYPTINSERCPTGDARVTLAYNMPCKWIIHTVGPIFDMDKAFECSNDLKSAYINVKAYKPIMLLDGPCRSSLAVANGIGANTIAFPAISCGVYGYPLKHACTEAIRACWNCSGDLTEVHFVLFGSDTLNVWLAEADKRLKPVADTRDSSASSNAGSASEVAPMDDTPAAKDAQDDSSPMRDASNTTDTQHKSSPMQATVSPATDEPSPVQGTTALQQSSGQAATGAPNSAERQGTKRQGGSVQTLTGVKSGEDSKAPQEALAAPEVLEAAAPANDINMPGHGGLQNSFQKGMGNVPDADFGNVEAAPGS